MLNRGLLVVLPRGDEDTKVRDNSTAQRVSSSDEGRAIKFDQIRTTLLHRGLQDLPIEFLNVQIPDDCEGLRRTIVEKVREIRKRTEAEIDLLVATIERLIANKKIEETRAVFQAATRPLKTWFAKNKQLPNSKAEASQTLVTEMAGLQYASSLRASVNRRGSWYNFNYWHSLGFGTRSDTVARTASQVNELKILIQSALDDSEFANAHDFLRFFTTEIEKALADFYQWAQTLGETAFETQLAAAVNYWSDCQERWGGGPGYKKDVKSWTADWFSDATRREPQGFIETEIQKRWNEILSKLEAQVSSKEQRASGELGSPSE